MGERRIIGNRERAGKASQRQTDRQTDVASAKGLQGGSRGAEHPAGAETRMRQVRHSPQARNLRGHPKNSVIKIK